MRGSQQTAELARDAELVRMRGYMDPKRFYKAPEVMAHAYLLCVCHSGVTAWAQTHLAYIKCNLMTNTACTHTKPLANSE